MLFCLQAYQQLDEPHLAQMNFSWALSLDPLGTNTMIKEAMNQQRFASLDKTTIDDGEEEEEDDDDFIDEHDDGDTVGDIAAPHVEQSVDDEVMSDS